MAHPSNISGCQGNEETVTGPFGSTENWERSFFTSLSQTSCEDTKRVFCLTGDVLPPPEALWRSTAISKPCLSLSRSEVTRRVPWILLREDTIEHFVCPSRRSQSALTNRRTNGSSAVCFRAWTERYRPAVAVWSFRENDEYVPQIRAPGVPVYSLGQTYSILAKLSAFSRKPAVPRRK